MSLDETIVKESAWSKTKNFARKHWKKAIITAAVIPFSLGLC